ncbi:hypothetical protein ACRAKI_14485 [Saccharothrix isguenensis]
MRLIGDGEPLADVPLQSADLVVVPSIACAHCSRTLSRAHRREPWGDLSYEPVHYVLSPPARLFGPEDVREAFTALSRCTRGRHAALA